MRYFKLLVMGGIVLALSSQAWAVGIPFNQPYVGATSWHLSNWDEGTLYTGYLADGSTLVTEGVIYAPADLERVTPHKGGDGEDSWGIFRVESIYNATVDYSQTDTIAIGSTPLYEYGAVGQTTEIVGMFTGRVDDSIKFVDLGLPALTQIIRSHGDFVDLYTQPKGTTELYKLAGHAEGWGDGMRGPSARLVAGGNKYPGIGWDAAGNAIVGSDLALSGLVQSGFQNGDVTSYFTPTPSGTSGSGTFGMYISWTGGSQLPLWDTNIFPIGYVLPPGITADMRLQGTITATGLPVAPPSGVEPWLVHTSDPATTSVAAIPEPVTMAGMLLGIGCLGRYLRKRR